MHEICVTWLVYRSDMTHQACWSSLMRNDLRENRNNGVLPGMHHVFVTWLVYMDTCATWLVRDVSRFLKNHKWLAWKSQLWCPSIPVVCIISLENKMDTHTHKHTHAPTYTHTHTCICTHANMHTHTHTHTNAYTHKHTNTHTRTHTPHTYTISHTRTHTRTHSHTLTHTLLHTKTHIHPNIHAHTNMSGEDPFLSFFLSSSFSQS